jgi:hypothetical protein
MGDGVLVYFGYPEAHEDDVERAVRAGLAVIGAVGALDLSQPLAVRLGIASGLVVVGDLIGEDAAQERGVVGETPNLAARLQAIAAPNRVVIADSTRRQLGGLFEIEDLEPQALPGFAEAPRAWQVVGESGQDLGAVALCNLSWALWHDGYPDQAEQTADQALLHAREFGHAHTLANTLGFTAILAVLSRDVRRVDRLAKEMATISGERGFPLICAWSDVLVGWVAALQGADADGVDRMRRGIAAATARVSRWLEPFFLGLVAEALELAGKVEEGLGDLGQALAASTESGERWANAELHRLRGDLLCRLPRPDLDNAERSLRPAIWIAREQGTRGFELRAATSLARLLVNDGRRVEARQLLAPVYDWFTEGFDFVDLKDAKALLSELA